MSSAGDGHRARKRFGQHFLHDRSVLDRIVAAIDARPGERLVEIGPGHGALTTRLFVPGTTLDVVEIDRDLAGGLRARHAAQPGFTLHEGDALEFDFTALARERGGPLRVAGNLPYNVSTPLLFHLLEHRGAVIDLHAMLQKEVVDRMAAAPGSDDYGRLTVMLAPWFEIEPLFEVGPGAFKPPPRVWSAVVRVRVRERPLFDVPPRYGAVVAAAFSQRRKTLRNALRDQLDAAGIAACGIDPGVRAETLAPAAFAALARAAERA